MTEHPFSPRVKICGLTRRDDARAADRAGADYLGAVLVPSSPRAVAPDAAAGLFLGLEAEPVVVAADRDPAELVAAARAAGAGVLQLHGDEDPGELRALRDEGPWTLWKAIRVRSARGVKVALERFGEVADALLLDGWDPRALGGTGSSFPWEEIRAVREEFPPSLRLVVAGGLDSENVGRAVELLEPDVVDVSSGVERRPGVKDRRAVRAFVEAARRAPAAT